MCWERDCVQPWIRTFILPNLEMASHRNGTFGRVRWWYREVWFGGNNHGLATEWCHTRPYADLPPKTKILKRELKFFKICSVDFKDGPSFSVLRSSEQQQNFTRLCNIFCFISSPKRTCDKVAKGGIIFSNDYSMEIAMAGVLHMLSHLFLTAISFSILSSTVQLKDPSQRDLELT